MLEIFERCAPVMALFRPHEKYTVCKCVTWLQASRERLRGTDLFEAISVASVLGELKKVVFRKNREARRLSLDARRQGRRKALCLRKSDTTKISRDESEERGPSNPMRDSSLQQAYGAQHGKLSRSDCAAA